MKKKNDQLRMPQHQALWDMFVKVVVAHVDPVLASMLYATECLSFDGDQKVVRVATLKKFLLFQDLFVEQKKIYQEYLDRIFGFGTTLVVDFCNTAVPQPQIVFRKHESEKLVNQNAAAQEKNKVAVLEVEKKAITLKEVAQQGPWNMTRALLESFGGSVREIEKDNHEQDA